MQQTVDASPVEELLAGWLAVQPEPVSALPARLLDDERVAEELGRIQRNRAREAAREAELILRLAELRPDGEDPAPGTPGARRGWRRTDPEFAGVSEFFPDEVAHAINLGRGTAAVRARRAFTWRDRLPATFAALARGEIDERRASALADALQHSPPGVAGAVEGCCCRGPVTCRWPGCGRERWSCWPNWTPTRSGSGTRRRSGPPTCAAPMPVTAWPPCPPTCPWPRPRPATT
ncbi:hypothetical protein U6N30_15275 [Blastococcus brunescens]|uniref:DUF222 domain-containing protein n=1 Tax=Blastococcus brunescens TaxID=1564165 RepID=A0ABZ1B8C2_9ACTN|nr:hypothetical protein [Blastococcus sp. BMG 8361]WRL66632.1 hypothetical protein U6N30_15275 [Blastococcus sp. BMG 8361]